MTTLRLPMSSCWAGLARSCLVLSLCGCGETSPECRDLVQDTRANAEFGNLEAQFKLGQMYERGECLTVNPSEAAKWYRLAAKEGHVGAQKVLGFMYAGGVGVEQDTLQAIYWFRKAAEKGHPEAQVGLGLAYIRGVGVAQNLKEAAKWFLRSAEQGFPRGQYNLGYLHETGQGVRQDRLQAYMWYKLAASEYQKADAALDRLAHSMTRDQIEAGNRLAKDWHARSTGR